MVREGGRRRRERRLRPSRCRHRPSAATATATAVLFSFFFSVALLAADVAVAVDDGNDSNSGIGIGIDIDSNNNDSNSNKRSLVAASDESNPILYCLLTLESIFYDDFADDDGDTNNIFAYNKNDIDDNDNKNNNNDKSRPNHYYACNVVDASDGTIGDKKYVFDDADGVRTEIERLNSDNKNRTTQQRLLRLPGATIDSETDSISVPRSYDDFVLDNAKNRIEFVDAARVFADDGRRLGRFLSSQYDPNNNGDSYYPAKRTRTSGTLAALMIRVSTTDSEPFFTAEQLYSLTFVEEVSLKRQMEACSHEKLRIEPTEFGVLDVTLPEGTVAAGVPYYRLTNQAYDAAKEKVRRTAKERRNQNIDSIKEMADLIMIVLPPGTKGDWAAYASVGGTESVYNDKWGAKVSATCHEIGHNLGLLHANQDGNEYRDYTGYMGISVKRNKWPARCFNPHNHWELGWYSDRAKSIDVVDLIRDGQPVKLKIAAFVDYGVLRNELSDGDGDGNNGNSDIDTYVVVRVGEGLYMQYNRKKKFNRDTGEFADMLSIVQARRKGTSLLAGLDLDNPIYREPRSDDSESVQVRVCQVLQGNDVDEPDAMIVSIGYGETRCGAPEPTTAPGTTRPTLPPLKRDNPWDTESPYKDGYRTRAPNAGDDDRYLNDDYNDDGVNGNDDAVIAGAQRNNSKLSPGKKAAASVITVLLALLGVSIAWLLYRRRPHHPARQRSRQMKKVLQQYGADVEAEVRSNDADYSSAMNCSERSRTRTNATSATNNNHNTYDFDKKKDGSIDDGGNCDYNSSSAVSECSSTCGPTRLEKATMLADASRTAAPPSPLWAVKRLLKRTRGAAPDAFDAKGGIAAHDAEACPTCEPEDVPAWSGQAAGWGFFAQQEQEQRHYQQRAMWGHSDHCNDGPGSLDSASATRGGSTDDINNMLAVTRGAAVAPTGGPLTIWRDQVSLHEHDISYESAASARNESFDTIRECPSSQ